MDLDLVSKDSPTAAGRIFAASDQILTFDLVVRALLDGEQPPPALTVRAGKDSAILSEIPSAAPVLPGDVVRAHLMHADKLAFYRFTARLPASASHLRHTVLIEVDVNGATDEHSVVVTSRSSVLAAMVVLLVAVLLFGYRLLPTAMKLAPTNWNLVLGLVLKGAPAAVIAGLAVGAFKDSISNLNGGELSVLGMRRPETMLVASVVIACLAGFLPQFCWEFHNRTPAKLKANWSVFESADFASADWVSGASWSSLGEADVSGLLGDYQTRYCAIVCPSGGGPGAALGTCAPATETNAQCAPPRSRNSYEIFCRSQVWSYGSALEEPLNAAPGIAPEPAAAASAATAVSAKKSDLVVSRAKADCTPAEPVEATAACADTKLRLIWSETDPPSESHVYAYLGVPAPADNKALQAQVLAVSSSATAERALPILVDALAPADVAMNGRLEIRATPLADTSPAHWLRWTSTAVTTQAHTFFVPRASDEVAVHLTFMDARNKSEESPTLDCTRTGSQPWAIRVMFPNGLTVHGYEQSSGGVFSRWRSAGRSPFVAACYDSSLKGAPSSAIVNVERAPDGSSLLFGRDQAPAVLSVSVENAHQGDITCQDSGKHVAPDAGIRFEPRSKQPSNKGLTSSGEVTAAWTGAPKGATPWVCTTGQDEKETGISVEGDLAAPSAPARVAAACCFSAGQLASMSCAEPGWVCKPASFRKSMSDWLQNNGCVAANALECFRAVK